MPNLVHPWWEAGGRDQGWRMAETFDPIEPPWQAIREWIPADDDAAPDFDLFDQRLELRLRPPWAGVAPGEAPREDGCILVLNLD